METKLELIVKDSGLELSEGKTLLEKFGSYEQIAKEWEVKAKSIVVTDASQVTEMAMAKTARKKFSDLRIELDKTRKALKEQSLRKTQAIDAIARFLLSLISPIEEYLKTQEDFVKIQAEKKAEEERIAREKKEEEERIELEKKQKLYNDRKIELMAYVDFIDVEKLTIDTTEKDYQAMKSEGEVMKKKHKEQEEKDRIENERLKKEAEAREKKLADEKAKADEAKRKADEKLRLERQKAEEKLRKEREESERLAKIEREKNEKRIADEKAKLEKERLEKEKIQKKLDAQIECPHCHKKFTLERK